MAANAKSSSIRSQAGKWKGSPSASSCMTAALCRLDPGNRAKSAAFYPVCATIERARAPGQIGFAKYAQGESVGSAVSVSRQCGSRSAGSARIRKRCRRRFFGLNGLDDWMGFMQKALPMCVWATW
ncbi:hypothetical protein [Cohnella faecalis]|uniref:Uncharacterized protein n=1 Tax=Cohnella faecalis TaxID=2315694 RepID=A0A398D2Y5_9BACL|nr:hypothetical protein [Cohnella faecalis]RIE05454.1 hypothetical protein D3H35_00375 [Cohnella faecalis]